jgi:uncharacterized membrane protein YiaA
LKTRAGVLALLASGLVLLSSLAQLGPGFAQEVPPAATDPRDAGVAAREASEASSSTASAEASGPTTVYVGIYPLRIGDLDLRTGTAQVTYYQWQRWRDPPGASDGAEAARDEGADPEGANPEGANLEGANPEGANPEGANPEAASDEAASDEAASDEAPTLEGASDEPVTVDGASVEVVNGEIVSSESEYVLHEDGVHYVYHRFTTRAQLHPDFHAFPFDAHEVSIELEHASEGASTILLAVDEEGVRHVESPPVAGWMVDPPVFDVVTSRYATSFGMPGVSPDEVSEYPRVRMRVRLHHDASTTFWKTFLTLFISVLIALLGAFMHHDELEARVGVGVAGIFGAVTSQSVVAANLPDIPYMTLSDKVHLAGIVFVFLGLLESCAAGWFARHDRAELSLRLDRVARHVMAPSFAICVILLLVLR